MAKKIVSIKLRRDTINNYASHANHIPLKGEVCIVDPTTTSTWATEKKIRIKIGDGITPYGDLPYVDQQNSNVFAGYYHQGKFYFDAVHQKELTNDFCDFSKMIFIDLHRGVLYSHNGEEFIASVVDVPGASSTQPGIMKLYQVLGGNIDGTMSQKAITDAISAIRLEVDDESLGLINPVDDI